MMMEFMGLKMGTQQNSPKIHPYPNSQLYHHEIDKLLDNLGDIKEVELSHDDKLHSDAFDDLFPGVEEMEMVEEMEEPSEADRGKHEAIYQNTIPEAKRAEYEAMYQNMLKNEKNVKFLMSYGTANAHTPYTPKEKMPLKTEEKKKNNNKVFDMSEMDEKLLFELTPESCILLDFDTFGPGLKMSLAKNEEDVPSVYKLARRLVFGDMEEPKVQVATKKRPHSMVQVDEKHEQEEAPPVFKVPIGVPPRRAQKPGGKKGRKLPPGEAKC